MTTERTAAEQGLVVMMYPRHPGKCARCGAGLSSKRKMGWSAAAKLAFCSGCADGISSADVTPRAEEIRALIAAKTVAPAPAATSTAVRCGQCQSCLAGGGPCDEQ